MNNLIEKKYHGIWPVLVTPYKDDLSIDFDAYHEMLEWYLSMPLGGIYANCQSSEMSELSDEERLLLISEAVKVSNGRKPIVGTGNFGDNIDEHIKFIKKAADAGAEIVMLTVPIFHNSDDELEKYYLTIAENTEVKLGLYECPAPRTYNLGTDLVKVLAESGRFYAYKETSCDIEKMKKFIDITRGTNLSFLQANVPFMLEAMRLGAEGSMNIASNWLPDLEIEVIKRGLEGDQSADELNSILCAMEMAQRSVHPMGVKYLIGKRGLPIKPLTRYPRSISMEEMYSLDQASNYWFEEDGALKILKESKYIQEAIK